MTVGQAFVTIMFGGGGLAMTVTGIASLVRTRRFVATATRTTGTVVAHEARIGHSKEEDRRSVRTTFYYPVVEFKDGTGMQRRVTSATGSSPKPYTEGATVKVVYDPDNPAHGEIETFSSLWIMTAFLLGGGTLFLLIAIAVMVFNVKVEFSVGF